VTKETYEKVKDSFPFVERGEIEVKGGIKFTTYLLSPLDPSRAELFAINGFV